MSAGALALVATDGVVYGLLLFLIGTGLSVSMHAGRVLNLAHGSIVLAGAYLVWWVEATTAAAWIATTAGAVIVGCLAGLLVLLLARLADGELRAAVATAGLGYLAGWALPQTAGGQPQSVSPPDVLAGSLHLFGLPYPRYRIALFSLVLLVATGLLVVWQRTTIGLLLRAFAEDPDLLELRGESPSRIRAAAVIGSCGLAGVAGVWAAPITGAGSGLDHTFLVSALVIAIAGGGTMWGALVAALTIGQVQTSALVAWPAGAPYLPYVMLFAVLLIRSLAARFRLRPS